MKDRPLLFSDEACPFARRVVLLLEFLQIPYEHREAPVGQTPDGLEDYSPSKRIPLLAHEGLVLTESRVILEYLGARFDFDGYPADLELRTKHVHAMAVADDFLGPRLFVELSDSDTARLEETLDIIETATRTGGPAPNFLAFQIAPMWEFLCAFRSGTALAAAIRRRGALLRWLKQAVVVTTADPTGEGPARLLAGSSATSAAPWKCTGS